MGHTILIVEDDEGSRTALTALLEDERYRVIAVKDGVEGMRALDQEPVDLLISDVNMPRFGGLELAAWVRARADLSRMPIILWSASPSNGDSSVADEFVFKPVEPTALLELIQAHLPPA